MRIQYFRSWASYQIPVRPTQPVSYAELEQATSFYCGTFDDSERLVRFEKFLRTRTADGTHNRESKGEPGHSIFYIGTGFAPSNEVAFASTQGQASYYEGTVDADGHTIFLTRVHQPCVSVDAYEYWPNWHLKSRRLRNADRTEQYTEYDQRGRVRPAVTAGI